MICIKKTFLDDRVRHLSVIRLLEGTKFAKFCWLHARAHGSRLGRAPAPVTASTRAARQPTRASFLLGHGAPERRWTQAGLELWRRRRRTVGAGRERRDGARTKLYRAVGGQLLCVHCNPFWFLQLSALHMHSDFWGCGDGVHLEPTASSDRNLQLDCSNFLVWWSRHVFGKMSATIPCMLLLRYAPENNLRTNKWMMSVTAVVELSCSCTAI